MTTKNIILEKAIALFNIYGYSAVTMRDIADATNKSVGNITYHFNKKSDLIGAIVELEYEDFKSLHLKQDIDINELNTQLKEMLVFQKKYYFYFLNMLELRKEHAAIKNRQIEVRKELTLHFTKVIENFEKGKIFKESPSKENIKYLAKGIVLLMMSWVQQITPEDETEKHEELLAVIWSVLYPRLTVTGIFQYNEISS
jgi:AcrR family transcriptional regulator